jgi:DNA replication protein DnaC
VPWRIHPSATIGRGEDWGVVLGDKVMASAILDRIVHHAHILKFEGDSYRIKDFLSHFNNIF